jgi:hypothetical protein
MQLGKFKDCIVKLRSDTMYQAMPFLICSLLVIISTILAQRIRPLGGGNKASIAGKRRDDHKITPSVSSVVPIDSKGKFSVTSMSVQHRSDTRWYVPHFHDKNSAGWNRTVSSAWFSRIVLTDQLIESYQVNISDFKCSR